MNYTFNTSGDIFQPLLCIFGSFTFLQIDINLLYEHRLPVNAATQISMFAADSAVAVVGLKCEYAWLEQEMELSIFLLPCKEPTSSTTNTARLNHRWANFSNKLPTSVPNHIAKLLEDLSTEKVMRVHPDNDKPDLSLDLEHKSYTLLLWVFPLIKV